MIAKIRALLGSERGTTLPELLVGMLITSLVLGAAAVMFDTALRTNQRTIARADTVNASRISVESMSRSLRTAVVPQQSTDPSVTYPAFTTAEAAQVVFYANINNANNLAGFSQVTYQVVAGVLTQTIQTPDTPLPDSPPYGYTDASHSHSTVLASGVDSSQPLFTYYDKNGNVLPLSTTCPDGKTCLSSSDLNNVDAMDVRVTVAAPAGMSIGPSTYILRVAMPNHDSI